MLNAHTGVFEKQAPEKREQECSDIYILGDTYQAILWEEELQIQHNRQMEEMASP
jgi:hypothetical protein